MAAIVVGTDQGLCGPIDRVIAQVAARWFDEHTVAENERWVVLLGARLARELEASGVPVDEEMQLASSLDAVGPLVEELILQIDGWRHHDGVGRVMVFHQRPLQRIRRTPRIRQVVPPDVRRLESIAAEAWPD